MAKRKTPQATPRRQTAKREGFRTDFSGAARKNGGHAPAGVIVTFTGQFGSAGPFGGTGFEDGSFSGTFTIDPLAVDQHDSSQLQGDIFGIYDLAAWNIDFFDSPKGLLGHAEESHGGTGIIRITQDPGALDEFGNIDLGFSESANSFFSTSSFPGLSVDFAAWFDSPSITTDVLPTSFLDATYTGDGLLAFANSADFPATFIASASISTAVEAPETATLTLDADNQEMSERSSISLGTVEIHLHRAYDKFRRSGREPLLRLLRENRH